MRNCIGNIRGLAFRTKSRLLFLRVIFGRNLRLYSKLKIKGPGTVEIGDDVAIFRPPGDSRKYTTLYTHSLDAKICIGTNVCLVAARISSKFQVTIGDNAWLEDVDIADTDFHTMDISRRTPTEQKEKNKVKIGNNVVIGSRSIIKKGVSIGDNVIVHPGTVVSNSIPSDCEVAGNPARRIR